MGFEFGLEFVQRYGLVVDLNEIVDAVNKRIDFVVINIRGILAPLRPGRAAWQASDDPPSFDFRRDRGCAGHRTRGHCALSAMLTVSQLSKSFAGRALFDDVSLQVNRGDRIVEVEGDGGTGDLQEDVGQKSDPSSKIVLT